jgi:hypothetical protein
MFGLGDADMPTANARDGDEPAGHQATNASPIAITSDDRFVWSVNPDNDSVPVFRVAKDRNRKVDAIKVGKEPWCVAVTPRRRDDDRKKDRDDEVRFVASIDADTEPFLNVQRPAGVCGPTQ